MAEAEERFHITDSFANADIDAFALRLHVNSVVTVLVSALIVFLVLRHSSKGMGPFRFYLLNIQTAATVCDIFFSFVFVPLPLIPVPGFCASGIFSRHWGHFWGEIVNFIVLQFAFAYVGVSLVAAMLYRYWSVTGRVHLLHSRWAALGIAIASLLYPVPAVVPLVMCEWDIRVAIHYLQQHSPTLAPFFASNACHASFNVVFLMWYLFSGLLLIVGVTVTVATLSLRTRAILNAKRTQMTAKTFRLHQQLLRTLWVQFSLPLFVVGIPVAVLMLSTAIGLHNLKDISMACMQVLSLHAACNGVVVIYNVAPYREAVVGTVQRVFLRSGCRRRRHAVNSLTADNSHTDFVSGSIFSRA